MYVCTRTYTIHAYTYIKYNIIYNIKYNIYSVHTCVCVVLVNSFHKSNSPAAFKII